MARNWKHFVTIAVCSAGGLLGLQPDGASAAHMIGVVSGMRDPICADSSDPEPVFIEAWGFDDISNVRVCELIVNPAAMPYGLGQCNTFTLFPASSHAPRITQREASSYRWIRTLKAGTKTPWGQNGGLRQSPLISHQIPARGGCPAQTVSVASYGTDIP